VNYCVSAIHHIAGQDPKAVVPSHVTGVLLEPTGNGTVHHNMIAMEDITGGLIEIMQGLVGGGGIHVFLFLQFLAEVHKDLCKRSCASLKQAEIVIKKLGKAVE
jgi:hypothetical protein